MRWAITSLTLVLALALPAGGVEAPAEEVPVADMLAEPADWDGRRVTVTGELVGDYSIRPDVVWVQVNADSYALSPIGEDGQPGEVNIGLGARIPARLFADSVVGGAGRHGRQGPIVRLEGTFIHSDPDLSGETYLAVEGIELLQPARHFPLPAADLWLGVGVGLMLVAGAITWRARHRAA